MTMYAIQLKLFTSIPTTTEDNESFQKGKSLLKKIGKNRCELIKKYETGLVQQWR